MTIDSLPAWKRRRFVAASQMDAELAKAKLAAAREKYGREIRVFETTIASATASSDASDMVIASEETDDFYEFTPEDYYRLLATKKEDKHLKTKKIREAEEAARRSKMTKAVIRVRFPDNHTLEASFHPSETIQSLVDLMKKVIVHPEVPFYLYTTPPKKQLKDMSQDLYSAGFVPGAIVYFAYDVPKGNDDSTFSGPFLGEDVMSLQGLEYLAEQAEPSSEPQHPTPEPKEASPSVEQKPKEKKMTKPKWLKM